MTNRDKLLNMSIYDLLMLINRPIIKATHCDNCVLDFLEKKYNKCKYITCDECIQNYLNRRI